MHVFSHNDPVALIATKVYLKLHPQAQFNPKQDIVNFLSEIVITPDSETTIIGLSVNPKQLSNIANEPVTWITPFTNNYQQADIPNATIYSGSSQDYNDCLSIVEEQADITLRAQGGQSISQALYQVNSLGANGDPQVLNVIRKISQGKIPAYIDNNYIIQSWGTMPLKKEELLKETKQLNLEGHSILVADTHISYDEAKLLVSSEQEGVLYFDFKLTGRSVVKFVFKDLKTQKDVLDYLEDRQFTDFKTTNTSGYGLMPLCWYNILLD